MFKKHLFKNKSNLVWAFTGAAEMVVQTGILSLASHYNDVAMAAPALMASTLAIGYALAHKATNEFNARAMVAGILTTSAVALGGGLLVTGMSNKAEAHQQLPMTFEMK